MELRSDPAALRTQATSAVRLALSKTARRVRCRLASFHRDRPKSGRFLSNCVSCPLMRRERFNVTVPPCAAGLATRRFHTVCEARTELIAPASNRFVTDDDPAFEQQFFDITQAELKPEIPAHRATDDRRRKAVTMVKRFCIRHHAILLDHLSNVTVPPKGGTLTFNLSGNIRRKIF
jgi:hypothetical protein